MTIRARWWGALLAAGVAASGLPAQQVTLPKLSNPVRFAVIGDVGTGDKAEYDVAAIVAKAHQQFPFTFVILLGDNIYGSERPQDFERKFTTPYKPLLDAGVEFRAALGNHDDPNQRFYKPYGMGGERYYTFKKGDVRFYALDSNYMDPDQVKWLEQQLSGDNANWKIAYYHHPIYTTASRGPNLELRKVLEPLFLGHGVNVVFSGHEHIYERIKPQKGIYYFVEGGAAKLNRGDAHPGALTEKTFDTDRSFMLVEIAGNAMYYQTFSGTGATVDRGAIQRQESITRPDQKKPAARPTPQPARP